MVKSAITCIFFILALNLTAQEVVVEYPYNPDFENDGNVGVEDLMQLLASFFLHPLLGGLSSLGN